MAEDGDGDRDDDDKDAYKNEDEGDIEHILWPSKVWHAAILIYGFISISLPFNSSIHYNSTIPVEVFHLPYLISLYAINSALCSSTATFFIPN